MMTEEHLDNTAFSKGGVRTVAKAMAFLTLERARMLNRCKLYSRQEIRARRSASPAVKAEAPQR